MEETDDFVKIFSKRLRHYISMKETTQEQVAEYVGVSPATVSFWCKGARVPRMDKIDALCKFFDCSRDDLMSENPLPHRVDLSADEWAVIDWYRTAPDHDLDFLRRMMAYSQGQKKGTGNKAM